MLCPSTTLSLNPTVRPHIILRNASPAPRSRLHLEYEVRYHALLAQAQRRQLCPMCNNHPYSSTGHFYQIEIMISASILISWGQYIRLPLTSTSAPSPTLVRIEIYRAGFYELNLILKGSGGFSHAPSMPETCFTCNTGFIRVITIKIWQLITNYKVNLEVFIYSALYGSY